jgi:hypothetical protein
MAREYKGTLVFEDWKILLKPRNISHQTDIAAEVYFYRKNE